MLQDGDRVPAGCQLADLLGDELLDRIFRARGLHVFVLDANAVFVILDDATASLLGPRGTAAVGAPFRAEWLLPASRIADVVRSGLADRATEPCLVVARDASGNTTILELEVFALASTRLAGGKGIACVLGHGDTGAESYALDSTLFSVTLAERLERERLETTQALIVTMRHEINNALTSLIGNGDLLMRRADAIDAGALARLREILNQAHRIQEVLDRIEGLTRVRTTTYLNGVRMVELDEPAADEPKADRR